MAQLNTIYDKDLKEKIFILKGEERYARTTDCILEEITHESGADVDPETGRRIDWNHYIDYMLLEFRIDVLRDIGASYVTLYDNDEVIGVYDFDTNSHHIDFKYEDAEHDNRLRFTYDVEHNVYAKYMGNKNCLKSKSKMYTFKEDTPQAYVSSITYTGLNSFYNGGTTSISFSATLVGEEGYASKTLKVYDGSTFKGSFTTGNDGSASVTITGLSNGSHNIRTVFEGDEYLSASEYTQGVSIGYIIKVPKYPSYVLNNEDVVYTVFVTDYFNYPVSNVSVHTTTNEGTVGSSVTTGSDGFATVTIPNSSFNTFVQDGLLVYGCESDDGSSSRGVMTSWYNNASVTLTARDSIISSNISTLLTGRVSNVNKSVTVGLSSNKKQGTDYISTSDDGSFSYFPYTGEGLGDTIITASITGSSGTTNIEDVLQYWENKGRMYNINYTTTAGTVTKQSNGWRFDSVNNDTYSACSVSLNEDWENINSSVEFKVMEVSGVNEIIRTSTTVSVGDIFRIEKYTDSNECKIYKNGQLIDTFSTVFVQSIIFFGSNGCYMVLDKIKQKRI